MPCFSRVIETRVEVWENEKCCGNTSRRRVFPHLFRVLPNFHSCFRIKSKETRRNACFLFLLENTLTKKTKNKLLTFLHLEDFCPAKFTQNTKQWVNYLNFFLNEKEASSFFRGQLFHFVRKKTGLEIEMLTDNQF